MRKRPIPAAALALMFAEMAPARALIAMILLMLAAPAAADINSTVTPGVGSATSCTFSGNNLICNKPPSTVSGHLLLFCEYDSSAGTVTGPAGFAQVSQFSANQSRATCYDKVAGGSEPSSYTLSVSSAPGVNDGILMDIANVGATPISGTPGGTAYGAGNKTYNAPAATGVAAQALNIVCGHQSFPETISIANAIQVATSGPLVVTTCWSYIGTPTLATITSTGPSGYFSIAEQIAIAPLQVQTGTNIATPAILNQPAGFSANVAANTPPYSPAANPLTGYGLNGCFNPVAYGADPTGSVDSSMGLNAAVAPACAAGQGTICIPSGTYRIDSQPWLVQCASGLVPNIVGAGMGSVTLLNNLGKSQARGGGPAIEIASTTVLADGAVAGLVKPALVGTGNSWNNTLADPFVFDLNYPLNSTQPLNGKSALTVEGCFSTTTNSATETLVISDGSATPQASGCGFIGPPTYGANPGYFCKGAVALVVGDDGKLYGWMNTGGTWTGLMQSSSAIGTGTVCAQISYDGSNVRLFHGAPNATMTMDAKVAASGTVTERQDEDLVMLTDSRFWHLELPEYAWQGQVDTFRISSVARCTNDAGCTAPNAKLTGDGNTIFLENWTNVSNLPLVGPEYTNGIANTLGAQTQSWMVADDITSGNPGNNHPEISGFTIGGGSVGIDMNVVAPMLSNVAVGSPVAGAVTYGFMAPTGNSYGIIGRNLWGDGAVPAVFNSGLTYLYGLNFTCGLTCGEFSGPEISGLSTLPSGSVKWGIILDAWAHLDSYYDDAEGGGTFPAIQISNMASPTGPSLVITNGVLIPGGNVGPINLDGATNHTTISDSWMLAPAGAFAYVDGTNSNGPNYVVFDNNEYGGYPCPQGSNTFTSGASVNYEVRGGCAQKQTTLNGTTAGTVVSSEPLMASNRKKFTVYLNGYQNTAGTAQTISMPLPFATVIGSVETISGTCTGVTATTSTVTLPSSMGAAQTGLCSFDGL